MVRDVRTPRATGRPGVPGRPPKKRKMPLAARGKTTKKGKVKKILTSILQGGKITPMVSPKTKAKQMQNMMRKMKTMSPGMKKAITGTAAGMGGAGLMAMARKLKPTGRLNAADLERVKKAMGKKTGGEMTRADFKRMFDNIAKNKIKSPPGQKPVLDSKGNPVKNLFQKDNSPKNKRGMQKPRMPRFGPQAPRRIRKRILGRKIK